MSKAKPQAIAQRLTARFGGSWCEPEGKPPFGELLRCPLCGKYRMKVALGDRGNPLVFCLCSRTREKRSLLIKAVTKETGIWLVLKPRRVSAQKMVERMRRSPEYQALPPRSRALVDLLVDAVLKDGLSNGEIVMPVTVLMAALGTRSARQFYEAVDLGVKAGIDLQGVAGLLARIAERAVEPVGRQLPSQGQTEATG